MTKITAAYDRAGDVLYVVLGELVAIEGDGLPGGVELDFAQDDGSPAGVTVIGFLRNHWLVKLRELADISSRHLSVTPNVIEIAIERAVGER